MKIYITIYADKSCETLRQVEVDVDRFTVEEGVLMLWKQYNRDVLLQAYSPGNWLAVKQL